jgi:hypothetical protein
MNKLSIRPQNDSEKILLSNLGIMIQTGKMPIINYETKTDENGKTIESLILEIKSKE